MDWLYIEQCNNLINIIKIMLKLKNVRFLAHFFRQGVRKTGLSGMPTIVAGFDSEALQFVVESFTGDAQVRMGTRDIAVVLF